MPRGKKSKARARDKRHQDRDQLQQLKDAQGSGAQETESSSPCAQVSAATDSSTSTAGPTQKPQEAVPTITAGAGVAGQGPAKGAKGLGEGMPSSSRAPFSNLIPKNDLITQKSEALINYILCKYKMEQPLLRAEMVRVINKRLREKFPEILKKASDHLEVVFGLELKEAEPSGKSFILVSKLDFKDDGRKRSELGLPTMGILVPVLSIIYINGSSAPEEKIWKFFNNIGIYDGGSHIIFGNVRKLITHDLVQEEYLEYRQVPGSDPPSYEFLWGPRAHSETSKKKVLNFLDKVKEFFPEFNPLPPPGDEVCWEEEEEEKGQAKAKAKGGGKGKAKAKAKAQAKARSKARSAVLSRSEM
uniref:melanoma-associated antigen B4-like n=1 Tax=Jaculus jaculus TaxID=51337 RepID=UPI001E1B14E2|nr:melanoma-associated antigen B4-like [Jaculus jaculus]XP_044996442.1 melanoma-associated antigen B4-like [Jaculus jaculus]